MLRITTEETEKEVGIIEEGIADFVSLVPHGANRQPFRILKQEGGDKGNMVRKIQSILMPTTMKLTDLQKDEKLGFLTEAKGDSIKKFDHYTRYEQADIKKFEKDSIQLVKLDKSAFAIVGTLVPGVEDKDIMSLSQEFEKAAAITDTVFDAPVEAGRQFTISFGDIFHKELDSFISIVINSMRQSSGDVKKRKQTVLNAFDAFRTFMVMGLETVDTAKFDETILDKMQPMVLSQKKEVNINKNLEETEMTKEEIQAMIDNNNKTLKDGIVKDVSTSLGDVVAKAIADSDKKKEVDAKTIADVKAKSDKEAILLKTVDTLTKTVEKMGNQLGIESGSEEDPKADAEAKKKADEEADEANKGKDGKKDENVFGGLMFKQT